MQPITTPACISSLLNDPKCHENASLAHRVCSIKPFSHVATIWARPSQAPPPPPPPPKHPFLDPPCHSQWLAHVQVKHSVLQPKHYIILMIIIILFQVKTRGLDLVIVQILKHQSQLWLQVSPPKVRFMWDISGKLKSLHACTCSYMFSLVFDVCQTD